MNKKKFGMRELIILLVIVLSAYTVWPSIQVHTKKGEEKQTFLKENPKMGAKSINFGLDLAGGTAITLEIDKTNIKGDDIKDIQEQSLEIIRNRVDQYGLSEPQISPSGDDRIVVELAGVDDSTAKALVGSTAKLEFKILAEAEKFTQVVGLIDQYLTRQTTDIVAESAATDSTAAPAKDSTVAKADSAKDTTKTLSDDELLGKAPAAEVAATDSAKDSAAVEAQPASEVGVALSAYYLSFGNGGFIAEENVEKVKKLLATDGVQKLIPRDVAFAFGSGLEPVQRDSKIKAKRLYLLKRRAEMAGDDVVDARPYRVSDGVSAGTSLVPP